MKNFRSHHHMIIIGGKKMIPYKNGTLVCLDVMERPNETSEAAHCWTCNGLIFNVKLQRFKEGGWLLDERKRKSIQICKGIGNHCLL